MPEITTTPEIGTEKVQIVKVPKYGLTIELKGTEVVSVMEEEKDQYSTLTPREKEIVKMVSEGKTNAEIAETLDISKRTVEIHRSNAMRKLHLRPMADQLIEFAKKRV